MSRCNPALRWGSGTTREKITDTAATREIEQRLAAMRRDRDAIDKMWASPCSKEVPSQEKQQQTPTCQPEEDKKYITFRSSN